MKRIGLVLLIIGAGGLLFSLSLGREKLPLLQANIFEVVEQAKEAGFDAKKWEDVRTEAEALPRIFPISNVRNALLEAESLIQEVHEILETFPQKLSVPLRVNAVQEIFSSLDSVDQHLKNIQNDLTFLPAFLLSEEQKKELENMKQKIETLRAMLSNAQKIEEILESFAKNKERVLVLLENQNEPRSTGGFVGSLLVVDFTEEKIEWRFEDIYALDRLVPGEVQEVAPDFFHDLSKTISLRDANFWPDFPTSSRKYQKFFESVKEKIPTTILALDLHVVEEALKLTGPVSIARWGTELNDKNFDLVLQFLVEGKVTGRFGTKEPVMEFASALFDPEHVKNAGSNAAQFDLSALQKGKHILAWSEHNEWQQLFEQWNVAGRVERNEDSDNFLYFDFVSIGANKSEKFVWTKISHNSKILKNGRVANRLEIVRSHALKLGEMEELLQLKNLPLNVQDLLNTELKWKLGEGQNRTVLRIFVPREARLRMSGSPSGPVREEISDDKKFKIFEVPLFILPGEKLTTWLEYETPLDRGNAVQQPYFLQVIGTPGRDEKTTFLETISTDSSGNFRAETKNIGLPQELQDADFRAVAEFEK